MSQARWNELKEQVSQFPQSSGVYLMKSQAEKIIYVGKAKNLRARVRSYFQSLSDQSVKTRFLMQAVWWIEYILTPSELEALLLEAQLIKKYRPKYNIRLKDDKSYPYIKIDWSHPFPKLSLSRKVTNDGGFYFGPYPKSQVAYKTIEFLSQTFQIRDCSDGDFKQRKRPCLTYEMKRCTAPCVGLASEENYKKQVRQAQDFMNQTGEQSLKSLEQQMWRMAEQENFEQAARIRDQLAALQVVLERQQSVTGASDADMDVVAIRRGEPGVLFETFHVRKGRELGSRSYFFSYEIFGEDERDLWVSFLAQYYEDQFIPDFVYLGLDLGGDLNQLLSKMLSERGRKSVLVAYPTGELGQQLLAKAQALADEHWEKALTRSEEKEKALWEIKEAFSLPELPWRIEAYDISHFQGQEAVASRVVFEGGEPAKDSYRRYRLQAEVGGDDYASMREVLSRRFKLTASEEPQPQLLLIDGGKGQLQVALRVLEELGLHNIPVVSLAKARTQSDAVSSRVTSSEERFFIPGRSNPVRFMVGSPAYRILVSLRDEAHRFAVSYHRILREKGSLASVLDELDGIGEVKKHRILSHFPSLEDFMKADTNLVAELLAISPAQAQSLQQQVETRLQSSKED